MLNLRTPEPWPSGNWLDRLDVGIHARLANWMHASVAPADDPRRPGVHNVGDRERAEEARDSILSALGGRPHRAPETELSQHLSSIFSTRRELLCEIFAQMRAAAASSEVPRLDLRALESGEFTPLDERGLLARVVADIRAVARAQTDGEFAYGELFTREKRTVRENLIQKWLANSLSDRSLPTYRVSRENELANGTTPDFVAALQGKAAQVRGEVKVAESWTGPELEAALRLQLVGQYLATDDSRHGVLVLVHVTERPGGWQRRDGSLMAFEDLITHLEAIAATEDFGPAVPVVVALDLRASA
jgi:hypothetical protein